MRERWLGATGLQVPEIAVEGELQLPDDVVWLDEATDEQLHAAHETGRPVVARASSADGVRAALAHPEVASVLVPPERRDLVELDLTSLTYG